MGPQQPKLKGEDRAGNNVDTAEGADAVGNVTVSSSPAVSGNPTDLDVLSGVLRQAGSGLDPIALQLSYALQRLYSTQNDFLPKGGELDLLLKSHARSLRQLADMVSDTSRDLRIADSAPWLRGIARESLLTWMAKVDPDHVAIPSHATRAWQLSSSDARAYYQDKALRAAGINPKTWDPRLGTTSNRATIEAVYQYYANLYLGHPDQFWWAGMASMIGGSFYGGFQDLAQGTDIAELIKTVAELPSSPSILGPLASMGATEIEAELHFYESRLLSMQKEIFLDMATAHEAYLDGGMVAIRKIYAQDPAKFGQQTIEAWEQIDRGYRTCNQDLVAAGNRMLLFREQLFIINDDYQAMKQHPLTGEAMTYIMTMIGSPSIPKAKSFADLYPVELVATATVGTPERIPIPFLPDIPLPHASESVTVRIGTPLPSVNVADFDSRWALIEDDTLPTYIDLATRHPQQIRKILSVPVKTRADDYRLVDNLKKVITTWKLSIAQQTRVGFG